MTAVNSGLAVVLTLLTSALWSVLTTIHRIVRALRVYLDVQTPVNGIASGKTVLVTTGRQAKTLHITRALKEVGARVIVTDYEPCSASAVSTACDHFEQMPRLDPSAIEQWVDSFELILRKHDVDVVIPVSTINEVLFLGLARDRLQDRLPHIHWLCPTLSEALALDDRERFASMCSRYDVPAPESGMLTSREGIENLASGFSDGVIVKRIASSVNREEEVVRVQKGEQVPSCVAPSESDPWQWQRFVTGKEYSAWYVAVDGKVTFRACYHSQPDLVHFDPADIPTELDESLCALITDLNLSGQFAFDFFVNEKTGKSYVIECNPRASSILETVSNTPLWGEAFFGIDVTHRTIKSSVGFLYHGNCFPYTNRSEGFLRMTDPLPFFAAEVVWPLRAIAEKGLTEKSYQKIDVNICKIIIDGPSVGRDLAAFERLAEQMTNSSQSSGSITDQFEVRDENL